MKRTFLVLVMIFLVHNEKIAAETRQQGLTLRATFVTSDQKLTNEKAYKIDPSEANPHRQRWMLQKNVDLIGLKPVKKGEKYTVTATEVVAVTKLYVRGSGPWYRDFAEFSCAKNPDDWFATEEGSAQAGRAGATIWEEILDIGRTRLPFLFSRILVDTPDAAVTVGKYTFSIWLKAMEAEWAVKGQNKARIAEWQHYFESAQSVGLCKRTKTKQKAVKKQDKTVDWGSMIEPSKKEGFNKLLARAPARRWDGIYSVRLSINVGGVVLNGQFMIDSGAKVSAISPNFLKNQGINPTIIEVAGVPPQRVVWSGGSGVGKRVGVTSASLSGFKLPYREFLLLETELFYPPDYSSTCCDGVLGTDFLRLYAVEFEPTTPPAIKVWDRDTFSLSEDSNIWVEVSSNPKGHLISDCDMVSKTGKQISYARWDSGSEMAVDVHIPWQKLARAGKEPWNFRCGSKMISEDVPITFPDPLTEDQSSHFRSKVPGLNVGMALLGRGNFAFDLSNGRLWLRKDALKLPIYVNTTGLELEYVMNEDNDRELRVTSIEPKSRAQVLAKEGLRKGALITAIDSKPAEEMDLWDVEQRLAGAYGKNLTIIWKTKTGLKAAPLKVVATE